MKKVLVWVLVVLMVGGVAYTALFSLLNGLRVRAVASPDPIDDYLIRVAAVYGSSAGVDFKTTADLGFSIGVNTYPGNVYTEIMTTNLTSLRVARNRNLKLSGDRYILSKSEAETSVFAYHISMKYTDEILDGFRSQNPNVAYYIGQYNGEKRLMIDNFYAKADADAQLSAMKSAALKISNAGAASPYSKSVIAYADAMKNASTSKPSETAMTVIDPANNKILFEFDNSSMTSFLGLKAIGSGSSHPYIVGYKGTTPYQYDGVLECSPYDTADYYGVLVVDVLPVETYITGVIPYEISGTWPLETQKAFAIAVRSFAIYNKDGHKSSYRADLCSGTDCQTFKGFGSTNATVRQAVSETKGIVATWKGNLCISTYSSSTGGTTANAWQVWNSRESAYGYLSAVATPWEKYENYGNGSWTSTASGQQIYETLKGKGYTALKSAVKKIDILELGKNSTYVYKIMFTDMSGNTLTVTRGDKVKSCLSPYLMSGNFVVGKAGGTVSETNYLLPGFGLSAEKTVAEGLEILGVPNDYHAEGQQDFSVMTATGIKTFQSSDNESVMTKGGKVSLNILSALSPNAFPCMRGIKGQLLPDIRVLKPTVVTKQISCTGNEGDFVFIGRGWGHGVGLSQWGIYDLGQLGYDYETIFKAYYTGVELVPYAQYINK